MRISDWSSDVCSSDLPGGDMRVSVATPASRSPCRLKIPSSDEAAPMSFIAVSLWGAFMMAAIFYTQEARHPATKPLVAYLSFTTTFSLTALILFGGLFLLLQTSANRRVGKECD